MNKSYIGVTGITSVKEAVITIKSFGKYYINMKSDHIPMVGVLVSYKSLIDEQYTNLRYPRISEIPDILFALQDLCFTTLHFNTRTPQFSYEISQLLNYKDIYNTYSNNIGIQLNISNPSPIEIIKIKKEFPLLEIIIQLRDIKDIDWISKCSNIISYILIDFSLGKGENLNVRDASIIYKKIKEKVKEDIGIGFAGGFTPDNIELIIQSLVTNINSLDFSIDVESGVRTNDVLDLDKAAEYIANASLQFNLYITDD